MIAAGRRLFGRDGFSEVGTESIVGAAGVTRGALYHHFGNKAGLFAAVLDQVEEEIGRRVAGRGRLVRPGQHHGHPARRCGSVARCQQRTRAAAHSVAGWASGTGLAGLAGNLPTLHSRAGRRLIQDGIDRGSLPAQPVQATTHVLVGAVDEAALYVAQSPDPVAARADADAVIRRITFALTAD